MFRIVFLWYNLHTFAPDQLKEESNKTVSFFGATFEKIWLLKATFELFEQRFEKSRVTCGKPQNITIANHSIRRREAGGWGLGNLKETFLHAAKTAKIKCVQGEP